MTDAEPGFEVEVARVGEFLRLLKERHEERLGRPEFDASREAVFVTRMTDRRPSSYRFPLVRRYVVAAFAYGPNVVSYRRTTSNAVELPELASKLAERQREASEQLRAEIERGLERSDLRLPVHEGFLRHPTDARHTRRDDSG